MPIDRITLNGILHMNLCDLFFHTKGKYEGRILPCDFVILQNIIYASRQMYVFVTCCNRQGLIH